MADGTNIEWTDATWNPVTGCSIVSPGCTNCYAMKLAGTRLRHHASRAGLTDESKNGPVWNGKVRLNEQWLTQPLGWRGRRRIFVCAHGDLFHESVPDEWIDKVFAVMALSPQHQFQVLTKRAARMRGYLSAARAHPVGLDALDLTMDATLRHPNSKVGEGVILQGDIVHLKNWPLPNVWLGVSAERQQEAEERIPHLVETPAALRFVSLEPLLGPIDLTELDIDGDSAIDALNADTWEEAWRQWKEASIENEAAARESFLDWHNLSSMPSGKLHPVLDWVIVGGESGKQARPMHPDWARSLRDQCKAAGVPFFFKQWGEWFPISLDDLASEQSESEELAGRIGGFEDHPMHKVGKKAAGRLLDGVEHSEMPA